MSNKDEIRVFIDEIYPGRPKKKFETNKTLIRSIDDC